jgi:hypothetical protein
MMKPITVIDAFDDGAEEQCDDDTDRRPNEKYNYYPFKPP